MTVNNSNTEIETEPDAGVVDTVGGHQVVRPETFSGVNIEKAKRKRSDARNPLADVVGRQTGTVYHVVPKHGAGVGVLVTILRFMQASSWEPTSVTGPAQAKNTPADVRVNALLSPLKDHDPLPSEGSYDPDSDEHAVEYDGVAAALLPDERLMKTGLEPRETERHELVPEQANWYRFTE